MDKIEALLNWAKSNGAAIPSTVNFVQLAPGNIGAEAESSGSVAITVPVKTIVKLSDALESFDFDAAALVKKTRNINAFAKLFLARERAPEYLHKSFFAAYIDALPSAQAINSPYLWLPEDQKLLSGSNLGSSLRENLFGLVEEWWSVISLMPEDAAKPQSHFMNMKFYYEHKFYEPQQLFEYLCDDQHDNWTSFPAYLWALMIYKSRSFPCKLLEGSSEVAEINFLQEDVAMLIPVVDLLNHNPKSDVTWSVKDNSFVFETSSHAGGQLYNNYGRKGNEELLLAYGFCLADNAADSVALKIKVPLEMLPELEAKGVVLPKISDYTTSVVNDATVTEKVGKLSLELYEQYKDGLVYFINKDVIPESLISVFQWLVRSKWETKLTLRMQLSGLNHLRQAVDSKAALINVPNATGSANAEAVAVYLTGQKNILRAAVTQIKRLENNLLSEHKPEVLSLKSVYKKDTRFAQSLLVTMGVTSYNDILEQELMDQIWLIYLIRCFNKDQYKDEDPSEQYLPDWIHDCFVRMDKETEVSAQDVLQFREIYENLILPINQAVPEIYNVGKWTVRELVVSTKLLDTIGFVRGKKQECLLVDDFTER